MAEGDATKRVLRAESVVRGATWEWPLRPCARSGGQFAGSGHTLLVTSEHRPSLSPIGETRVTSRCRGAHTSVKCQYSHISQLRAGRVKRDPVKNESCSWFGPALSLPPLACLNMRKGRSRHRPLVPVPEPEIARQGLSVSVPPARAGPGYGRIDGHPGWGFGSGGGGNAIWRTQVFRAILERRSVLESERGSACVTRETRERANGARWWACV